LDRDQAKIKNLSTITLSRRMLNSTLKLWMISKQEGMVHLAGLHLWMGSDTFLLPVLISFAISMLNLVFVLKVLLLKLQKQETEHLS
jgi:hypothetical protein